MCFPIAERSLPKWPKVIDIIVCGHSDCGAMAAIANDQDLDRLAHLKSWLKNA